MKREAEQSQCGRNPSSAARLPSATLDERLRRLEGARPLFAFDLDSTVTRCELLPLLARELGIEAEMAARTEACMAGGGDFAASFAARVALLREIPLDRARQIVAAAPLNPEIARVIRAHAPRCRILTGNLDAWIGDLIASLNMTGRCLGSRAKCAGNRLLGVEAALDKGRAAAGLPRPLVAVGDGSNDVPMLRAADLAIAFGGCRAPSEALLRAADLAIDDEAALCALLERLI